MPTSLAQPTASPTSLGGAAISGRQAGPIGVVVDAESRPCEYRCPAKVSEQHRLGPEAGGSPHAALGGHAVQAARRGLFQGLPLHALPAERADDQLVSGTLEADPNAGRGSDFV